MEDQLKIRKLELVEKLGVHFEAKDKLAPVAARIFAYIILTGKVGVTFEHLVADLCASKSTVSTHLKHLQDLNKITFFTVDGDRKKHFILNGAILVETLDNMISQWDSEKELHQEISDYKVEINETKIAAPELKFDLTYHDNYIKFLNLAIDTLTNLKTKVEKIKLLK